MSDIKPDQHAEHDERKGRPPYCLSDEKKKDGFKAKWTGQCYCGNVQVSPPLQLGIRSGSDRDGRADDLTGFEFGMNARSTNWIKTP